MNYQSKEYRQYHRKWSMKWRAKHREKLNKKSREYYAQNKEKKRAYSRAWYKKNSKKVCIRAKKYRKKLGKKYTTHFRIWMRAWRAKHPEKIKEYHKKYYDSHYNKILKMNRKYKNGVGHNKVKLWSIDYNYRRRANISKNECSITTKDLRTITLTFKICPYCQIRKATTFEHIIPLLPRNISMPRGQHIKENIIRVCSSCNFSKQDKDPIKWCKEKGYPVPEIVIERLKIMKTMGVT